MNRAKNLISILFLVIFSLICSDISFAQSGAREIRWLRVGSLHHWFSDNGAEIEYGNAEEQLYGMRWDAEFPLQDNFAAGALWIGLKDYADPLQDHLVVPYKVTGAGTRETDPVAWMKPTEFKMVGKFPAPTVLVDGANATDNLLNDIVDSVDANQKADRLIINTVHTNIGLTIHRKIYAFSQQNHDNYYIKEYTFKNTGIILDNSRPVDVQTLKEVIIFFNYRPGWGGEAYENDWAQWSIDGDIRWGRNSVHHQIGQGQNPNANPSQMRAEYSWLGKHSNAPFDAIGVPNDIPNGHLAAPQFVGNVTIHADKSPADQSDDASQPIHTTTILSNDIYTYLKPFNVTFNTAKYDLMTQGHEIPTMAEKLGEGYADQYTSDRGGPSQGAGYGPYTLAPGDSIRIVIAEGVAGISRKKGYEVNRNWYNARHGLPASLILPDGSTTSNPDVYKNTWVLSGKDSILQTFNRAIDNYKNGFNIPDPPMPPSFFYINSGGDQIALTWAANAEENESLVGYDIYRRTTATPDSFFTLIASVPRGTINYNDLTPQRGLDYYYYIQSRAADGLVSSKFYTMTNVGARLLRPAKEDLSSIRVVPNPYRIDVASNQHGADNPDRILFYGLPARCTIRIFTERGDLIETLNHTNGSADEPWNSLTSSKQLIVSGVYIAHFEVSEDIYNDDGVLIFRKGDSTFRKFIIIR